jgi:hypothetical protein
MKSRKITVKPIILLGLICCLLLCAYSFAGTSVYGADLQQANATITVASHPGGSVIVNSLAINNGQAVIVNQGQQQSWEVPIGTNVTLMGTQFASGLEFGGWEKMNGPNPITVCVNSQINVTGIFRATGKAYNGVQVALALPRQINNNLEITFTITNNRAPYTVMKEIYGITLYLDKTPVENLNWIDNSIDQGAISQFSTQIPISMVEKGNHSFFVLAKTSFNTPSPLPWDSGTLSDGQGISEIIYYQGTTDTENTPQNTQTTTSANTQTAFLNAQTLTVIGTIVVAVVILASVATMVLIRKKKKS